MAVLQPNSIVSCRSTVDYSVHVHSIYGYSVAAQQLNTLQLAAKDRLMSCLERMVLYIHCGLVCEIVGADSTVV